MRLVLPLLLTVGLALTGCESSRHSAGMKGDFRVDSGGRKRINDLGPIIIPTLPPLPWTIRTDDSGLKFELDGPGTVNDSVFIGPHSQVKLETDGIFYLEMGWMYWRGPRLVGRTRRFAPGPQVPMTTDPIYRFILQVDPYATDRRHFVYYAAESAFDAVAGSNHVIAQKGEFVEVVENSTGPVTLIDKSLGAPINDSQRKFFNYANKTAEDGGYLFFVTPY